MPIIQTLRNLKIIFKYTHDVNKFAVSQINFVTIISRMDADKVCQYLIVLEMTDKKQ